MSRLRKEYCSAYVQTDPDDYGVFDSQGLDFDFVSGHFPIARFLPMVPPSHHRFTFMRNPIMHLASQVAHLSSPSTITDEKKRYLVERACTSSLREFLLAGGDSQFQILCDNPQVRFILGLADEPLSHAHVKQAIDVLEELDFVGITEIMGGSMQWLSRSLGLEDLRQMSWINTNPKNRFDFSTSDRETLNVVLQRTWFDARVFDHFRTRLEKQLAVETPKPARTVGLLAPCSKRLQLADLFRTADASLKDVIFGEGYQILGDEILLHPPALGSATATIEGVEAASISKLEGKILIRGEHSKAVLFSLNVISGGASVFSIELCASCGGPVDIRASFIELPDRATIILTTQMLDPSTGNGFAWATFKGFVLTGVSA